MGDLLESIVRWNLSFGHPDGSRPPVFTGKLPAYYPDNTTMTVTFTASTAKVRRYLPHREMHPVELYPGRCLIGFTAFEYRSSEVGPYNELGIAIIITYGRRSVPGLHVLRSLLKKEVSAYIWHLPVTTEPARIAGVEIYGYPKILAGIDFKRGDGRIECALSVDGEHVLTLKGKALPGTRGKWLRYRTYSLKSGIPLCTNIYADPAEFAQSLGGSSASIEVAPGHPIGRELADIGLGTRPVLYQYSARNEAVLFAPRNIIDD